MESRMARLLVIALVSAIGATPLWACPDEIDPVVYNELQHHFVRTAAELADARKSIDQLRKSLPVPLPGSSPVPSMFPNLPSS